MILLPGTFLMSHKIFGDRRRNSNRRKEKLDQLMDKLGCRRTTGDRRVSDDRRSGEAWWLRRSYAEEVPDPEGKLRAVFQRRPI